MPDAVLGGAPRPEAERVSFSHGSIINSGVAANTTPGPFSTGQPVAYGATPKVEPHESNRTSTESESTSDVAGACKRYSNAVAPVPVRTQRQDLTCRREAVHLSPGKKTHATTNQRRRDRMCAALPVACTPPLHWSTQSFPERTMKKAQCERALRALDLSGAPPWLRPAISARRICGVALSHQRMPQGRIYGVALSH